jgi:hypothetical protein
MLEVAHNRTKPTVRIAAKRGDQVDGDGVPAIMAPNQIKRDAR